MQVEYKIRYLLLLVTMFLWKHYVKYSVHQKDYFIDVIITMNFTILKERGLHEKIGKQNGTVTV